MFIIDDSKNMYLNRGDQITIILTANQDFAIGDVIKFSIVKERDYSSVIFQKSFYCWWTIRYFRNNFNFWRD